MLTIEEIKQAVEFADGFYFENNKPLKEYCYFFGFEQDYSKPIIVPDEIDLGYYDLFLDRVIQGINRLGNTPIINQERFNIIVVDAFEGEIFKHDCTTEGIREAREETIRFVLNEVKS